MPPEPDGRDEQLEANSGAALGAFLTLPLAIYATADVVVQTGWYPVPAVILLSNLPLTLFRLWRVWYPFSFLGSVTPVIDLTDDQLRILSFLASREARRHTWEAGLVPALVLLAGVALLLGGGIVTVETQKALLPGFVLKPEQMPAQLLRILVVPWLLNAVSTFLCLLGWPFWRAYRDWARIVRSYPLYPVERFQKDFLAPRTARGGLGGPRRPRAIPAPNPMLQAFSRPLRWPQGVAAVLVILGVPALYRGAVTILGAGGGPDRSDSLFSAGLLMLGGLFLALGVWLWRK